MEPIVFLDSMIFIYWFDQDERFFSQIKPWFTKIESGLIRSITSIISVTEVLSIQKLQELSSKFNVFKQFFLNTEGLTVFDINWEIGIEAARLRRTYSALKTPDSLQLATALVHQASIFITNDKQLTKLNIPNLKIISLSYNL